MASAASDSSLEPFAFPASNELSQGLVDSLMCGGGSARGIDSMCSAVARALSAGGAYVVMTYGPPEDRLRYFEKDEFGWAVEIFCLRKPDPECTEQARRCAACAWICPPPARTTAQESGQKVWVRRFGRPPPTVVPPPCMGCVSLRSLLLMIAGDPRARALAGRGGSPPG